MFTRRTFGLFPLTAIAASLPLSMAAAAGLPLGYGDEPAAQALSPAQAVERARQLMSQNQPVAARALLLKAFENQTPSKEVHEESLQLLAEASRRIRTADPLDVSLQKARLAIDEGDYRLAEQHTQAVAKSASVSPDQSKTAGRLSKDIEGRRAALAATIPSTLEQAKRDFDAGRYSEAKAGLQMVDRSGAKLTRDQRTTLETYQMKLIALGDGALFGATASAGQMQPGSVKRREEQPAVELPPAAQPAAQPTQPAGQDLIAQAKRAEAAKAIAQADASFRDAKYPEALRRYEAVRSEYREVLTAEQTAYLASQVQQAQTRTGRTPAGAQPGMEDRPQRRNEAVATFTNDLDQAKRARESGEFARARDLVARGRLAINSNRDVFSETELESRNKQASDALAEVAKAEQAAFERDAKAKADQAAIDAKNADVQARQERDRKIVEFIDRARAYQSEKRYEEALQAVKQLLFLDPINATGLLLHDAYVDIIMYERANSIYNLKNEAFGRNSLDNTAASIPPTGLVNYPLDWPAISSRRGEPVQFAESPENRAVLASLGGKRIPEAKFNDNALRDVVEYIKTVTNLNVDADWASLEGASIQPDTTVSLNLTNVTAKTLLDRIVEKVSGSDRSQKADWAVIDGVVTIASDEKIRKRTELVIYDVKDLLIEVPDYRDVPDIDLQQALQASQGGGGGGQSPFRDQQDQENEAERDQAREENLDELIQIIRDNIDTEGWIENGGDTGKITKVGNAGNLIITNTPKSHRQIAGLLSKLREIRAMQINVETRFLLVNQDWFEQIGFDLDVYIDGGSQQVAVARGNDRTITPGDFFNFSNGGGLQRTVTGSTAPNGPVVGNPDGTQINQGVVNPNSWSPLGFGQNSLGLATGLAPQTDWSDAILGAAPALGIAGQFLDDVQVDFLIQATQADRRSIQLTAPRITFTNGQASNIYVATQIAFVSELEPVVGDSAVGFDPTVAVVTEGVTLLVEGTISSDRRYVTMNVDAGIARIDGFAQQAVSAVAGGQLVSSADTQSFIQLPQVTVTRVRTTVTVPDQGTILMGGQRLTTEYEIETGVPVLSKIPIINRFFTNRIESREEQTLLILVKPTVLIQNENEEVQFPGLLDTVRQGIGG